MSFDRRQLSPTDHHQEKEQDPQQVHSSQPMSFDVENCYQRTVTKKKGTRSPPALERVTSAKCLGGRVVREPPLGEAHPLNCCKSQQSECLRIQEPEGMLFRHTATEAFVRPCSVRARIRGVGHPSAISEIHIGDGATTISSYHPS